MIELYTYGTSNGQRASVMLEVCGLPYQPHKVDLAKGEHRRPEFLALNPAGQIPVIVDPDGPDGRLALDQSAAIIVYLAEKTGSPLLPTAGRAKVEAARWLTRVATDIMGASTAIFASANRADPPGPGVAKFYEGRFVQMMKVADDQLGKTEYLVGQRSVADIALYPTWAGRKDLLAAAGEFANLARWAKTLGAEPAIQRGMAVPG